MFFAFMQRFNELPCHFHKFHFKVNEFKYTGMCLNIKGGCPDSEPSSTQHSPPFYRYLEDVTVNHCNLATWENLLLPKILAYDMKQAQN